MSTSTHKQQNTSRFYEGTVATKYYKSYTWGYFDLMEQAGGRDLIIVEANALLEHVLLQSKHQHRQLLQQQQKQQQKNNNDNFNDDSDGVPTAWIDWMNHGGQFLQLTFMVERFLKGLVDRGIQFRVAFFDGDQHWTTCENNADNNNNNNNNNNNDVNNGETTVGSTISISNSGEDAAAAASWSLTRKIRVVDGVDSLHNTPQYSLAKRLLWQHLTQKCGVQCDRFESWYLNDVWHKYLRDFRPSLILTSSDHARFFTAYNMVTEEVPSACTVEFNGNTLWGFVSRLVAAAPELKQGVLDMIAEIAKGMSTSSSSSSSSSSIAASVIDQSGKQLVAINNALLRDGCNGRLRYSLQALLCVVLQQKDKQQAVQLAQLLFASQLLVTQIPLAYRAHRLSSTVVAELNDFSSQFARALLAVMPTGDEEEKSMPDLYDVIDGRLFYKLALIYHRQYLAQQPELAGKTSLELDMPNKDLNDAFAEGRKLLLDAATVSTDVDASSNEQWWKSMADAIIPSGTEPQMAPLKAVPMHNKLVDSILGEWNSTLPEMTQDEYEAVVEQESEDVRFWSAIKPSDDVVGQPTLTDRERRKMDETVKRLHSYGDSVAKLEEKKTIEVDESALGARGKSSAAAAQGQKVNAKTELMKMENLKKRTAEKVDNLVNRFNSITSRRVRTEPDMREREARLEKEIISKMADIVDEFNKNLVQWSQFVAEKKWKPSDLKQLDSSRVKMFDFLIQTQMAKVQLKFRAFTEFRSTNEQRRYELFETVNYVYDICSRWAEERGDIGGAEKRKDNERLEELIKMFVQLGFEAYAQKIAARHQHDKFTQLINKSSVRDLYNPYELQLKYNDRYLSVSHWFPPRTEKKKDSKEAAAAERASKHAKKDAVVPAKERSMFTMSFTPDPWQEQLINHVKERKSILCSAPTSSGKTFIAFYVIEKILRESNDGVVVFVLPSLALTNQVYAEVYARFNKTYKTESTHMLGLFTGMDKINVTNSQVLVTIPQCLEMLMLNPANNAWKRKIQYVILDEIHCIGSSDGAVWEHVLAMLNCPFLALSASIGNPEEFRDWLNTNRGDVELVIHKERPQALEYQVYWPSPKSENEMTPAAMLAADARRRALAAQDAREAARQANVSQGVFKVMYDDVENAEDEEDEDFEAERRRIAAEQQQLQQQQPARKKTEQEEEEDFEANKPMLVEEFARGSLVEIHPCAVLNPQRIELTEIENMPLFSSQQCLTLYLAAKTVSGRNKVENLFAALEPSTRLKPLGLITQREFSDYRAQLRERLVELASDPEHRYDDHLLQIFAELRTPVDGAFEDIYARYDKTDFDSEQYLLDNISDLVMRLKEQNQLPALLFHFNRYAIDQMLAKLVEFLKAHNITLWSNDVERNAAYSAISEVDYSIRSKVEPLFIDALRLGVAVHYSAMPGDYLKEVERLFRSRLIPCMFASGTLALGIHMPCRTVVLVGKSIYLTTSLFHQCAGRAGRRNFDAKGKVVLYGINQVSINRLMTGAFPRINGTMGLSPSFLMRLMMLYDQTVNSPRMAKDYEHQVLEDCARVLKQPLFCLGKVINDMNQVKQYFRFCLELMAREQYLDQRVNPMKFTGLLASMFYQEPMNFMFVRMLKEGVFHSIMRRTEIPYVTRLETLMNVLCHIYGRRFVSDDNESCGTLPELPDVVKDVNDRYAQQVLEVYSSYVLSFLRSFPDQHQDCELPLSGIKFEYCPPEAVSSLENNTTAAAIANGGNATDEDDADLQWDAEADEDLMWDEEDGDKEEEEAAAEAETTTTSPVGAAGSSWEPSEAASAEKAKMSEGVVADTLRKERINFHAVSSFYALSGNTDQFDSLEQLLFTLRHTILLDRSVIPCTILYGRKLNSYALDFFRHGLYDNIRKFNDYDNVNSARNDLEKTNRDLRSAFSSILGSMEPGRADNAFYALEELSTLFNGKCKQRPLHFFMRLKFSVRHVNEYVALIKKYLRETTDSDDELEVRDKLRELSGQFLLEQGNVRETKDDVYSTLTIVNAIMERINKSHPVYSHIKDMQFELSDIDREFKASTPRRRAHDLIVEDEESQYLKQRSGKDHYGDKYDPTAPASDRKHDKDASKRG